MKFKTLLRDLTRAPVYVAHCCTLYRAKFHGECAGKSAPSCGLSEVVVDMILRTMTENNEGMYAHSDCHSVHLFHLKLCLAFQLKHLRETFEIAIIGESYISHLPGGPCSSYQ